MNATDPRDLKADPVSGELSIVDGDLVLISGLAAVRQAIVDRLSLVRGEWFLDTDAGIPLFDSILAVKNPRLAIVGSYYRAAVLEVEGVKSVTSFDLAFDRRTRVATLTFSVDTDAGPLNLTIEPEVPVDATLDEVPFDLPLFD